MPQRCGEASGGTGGAASTPAPTQREQLLRLWPRQLRRGGIQATTGSAVAPGDETPLPRTVSQRLARAAQHLLAADATAAALPTGFGLPSLGVGRDAGGLPVVAGCRTLHDKVRLSGAVELCAVLQAETEVEEADVSPGFGDNVLSTGCSKCNSVSRPKDDCDRDMSSNGLPSLPDVHGKGESSTDCGTLRVGASVRAAARGGPSDVHAGVHGSGKVGAEGRWQRSSTALGAFG
mmetsp:Transcript_13741/g.32772  ORF Transcript_13741/g.32772 Transcript_13741/m.32772 type:complete len:234 (-) Transcript_13741:1202-1903(-)